MFQCYKKLATLRLRRVFFGNYLLAAVLAGIGIWLLHLLDMPLLSVAVLYRAFYIPYTNMNMKMELYEDRRECETYSAEQKLQIGSFDTFAWKCEWLAAIWARRFLRAYFIFFILLSKLEIVLYPLLGGKWESSMYFICIVNLIMLLALCFVEHYTFTKGLPELQCVE